MSMSMDGNEAFFAKGFQGPFYATYLVATEGTEFLDFRKRGATVADEGERRPLTFGDDIVVTLHMRHI